MGESLIITILNCHYCMYYYVIYLLCNIKYKKFANRYVLNSIYSY